MSSDLYSRGLWKNGQTLVLKDGDLTVSVQHVKLIDAIPEAEVDFGEMERDGKEVLAYYPEVRIRAGDARREMEAPEIAELKRRIAYLTSKLLEVLGIAPR